MKRQEKAIVKNELKKHLAESTAIATLSNLSSGALEIMLGIPPEASLKTRAFNTAIIYGGAGYAFSRALQKVRNIAGITEKSSKFYRGIVEGGFTLGLHVATAMPIYFLSGSDNTINNAAATAATAAMSFIGGYPLGYCIDASKELTGLEKTNRLPEYIRNKSSFMKKSLATIVTASLIGATALMYHCTNNTDKKPIPEYSQKSL